MKKKQHFAAFEKRLHIYLINVPFSKYISILVLKN